MPTNNRIYIYIDYSDEKKKQEKFFSLMESLSPSNDENDYQKNGSNNKQFLEHAHESLFQFTD